MQIFLSPNVEKDSEQLRAIYKRALGEAEELYIASAYLTDWDIHYKLNPGCKTAVFLVGTDFGLTRKKAMRDVLRWMPVRNCFFGAVPRQDGGFHPKIVAWRTQAGKCFCLIGSSNLSKAAFFNNYEANMVSEVSANEYRRLCEWLDDIEATPVSEPWISHYYKEAKIAPRSKKTYTNIAIKLSDLPHGKACATVVRGRRAQQNKFVQIGNPLRTAARRCAEGKITSSQFWQTFWTLWGSHESRFQGSGIQFKGKGAKWDQACACLIKILDASRSNSIAGVDRLVITEIDRLSKLANPMRRAWLSEMLCHYFPDRYPISNMPVQKWLSHINLRGRRGATEGQRYVDLALKLREAIRVYHPAGARNLAELDGAIWQLMYDRGLLK